MKKGLMVYKCSACSDFNEDVCVFTNIQEGKDYVQEMNKPRDAETKLLEECEECTHELHTGDKAYSLRDMCKRCNLKEDRYGKYCENEISSYYNLTTDSYYGREIEIKE